jgi:hypothetical protein
VDGLKKDAISRFCGLDAIFDAQLLPVVQDVEGCVNNLQRQIVAITTMMF